jgi:hypothetical protein
MAMKEGCTIGRGRVRRQFIFMKKENRFLIDM